MPEISKKLKIITASKVSVNLHIQSEYKKIQIRNNSVFGHISHMSKGNVNAAINLPTSNIEQ